MKRVLLVWVTCVVVSMGSFGVLMVEDRRLGVPTPYSLPLAFASMLVAAPALFALFERLRARRPIVIHTRAVPETAAAAEPERAVSGTPRKVRAASGLVLLDFSSMRDGRERAA